LKPLLQYVISDVELRLRFYNISNLFDNYGIKRIAELIKKGVKK